MDKIFTSRRFEETLYSASGNKSFSKSFSKGHKPSKSTTSFSSTNGVKKRRHEPSTSASGSSSRRPAAAATQDAMDVSMDVSMIGAKDHLSSPIITIVVGNEQRIFAAHEEILCASPFFQAAVRGRCPPTPNPNIHGATAPNAAATCPPSPMSMSMSMSISMAMGSPNAAGATSPTRRFALPDEEPEIFSSVLEFLYKGDYYPRLVHNKRRNVWELEGTRPGGEPGGAESTVYHCGVDGALLKDTVIYCAAERYGLQELKKVALRKQGLQSGIQCSTILSSARYAYANTPDTDSKLRAHYLALIIRSRSIFKRSGTMQMEMFNGGSQLFFDLFVALSNHVDDVSAGQASSKSNKH